jgi:PAS domain S-box-containing protein
MYLDIPQRTESEHNEKMFFITDEYGVIQFISPNCVSLLAFELDDILFKLHYLDLLKANYKQLIKNEVLETQKKGLKATKYLAVELNKSNNGKSFKLKLNVLSDKQGRFKGLLAELKQTVLGVVHSAIEKEYKQLLDNIPLGIYRTKHSGEIVYVNQSFLDIFHYQSSENIKNNNNLFVDKHYRGSVINEWIEKGEYCAEFKAYTKEGNVIYVKDEGKVIKDKEGNVIYFDGIIENISKQKEAEEKLQELNLSKDKFLSIISHDLKVPFGQFISATELILDKAGEFDIAQIEKIVRLLNEQAVKSYKLLENLLEWSRNQKGLIDFNPQPVGLDVLVNDVVEDLQQLADNKSITISPKIKSGHFIYADNYMLSTIIRNLVSNAIKFTNINGQITISSRYIFGEDAFGDKQLEISVADTGVGIRKEDIAKLFRIDTAFSSKGTEKESGTGLGLILCKDFVEKHGGRIWVESEAGKGSIFKFRIP